MAGADCGEPAEQTGQAKGADAGDQLLAGTLPATPAAFGTDQQADGQGRGEIQK